MVQQKSVLNFTELFQPFLSHCVNVKVTINLVDNYFHVYWQQVSSSLKSIVISLVSPVTYRTCYFSPVSNASKC